MVSPSCCKTVQIWHTWIMVFICFSLRQREEIDCEFYVCKYIWLLQVLRIQRYGRKLDNYMHLPMMWWSARAKIQHWLLSTCYRSLTSLTVQNMGSCFGYHRYQLFCIASWILVMLLFCSTSVHYTTYLD